MIYTTGQRVQSHDGKRQGTVTQDAANYASIRILWDRATEPRWELPECIKPVQAAPSVRDAWKEKASTK